MEALGARSKELIKTRLTTIINTYYARCPRFDLFRYLLLLVTVVGNLILLLFNHKLNFNVTTKYCS